MLTFWFAAAFMSLLLVGSLIVCGFRQNLAASKTLGAQPSHGALASQNAQGQPLKLRDKSNVELFRQRLAELEAQRDTGSMDSATYQQLAYEAKKQLLSDVALQQDAAVRQGVRHLHKNDRIIVLLAALLIPLLALFLYLPFGISLGGSDQWQVRDVLQNFKGAENASQQQQAMQHVIKILESQTQSLKPDAQLLNMLAGVYRSVGQYDKATLHYERLLAANKNDPAVMAMLAEALYLQRLASESAVSQASSRVNAAPWFSARMLRLLDAALNINPDQASALSLTGIHAFREQQYTKAVGFWQRAMAVYHPQSSEAKTLQNSIAEAKRRMGVGSQAKITADKQLPLAAIRIALSIDRSQLSSSDLPSTPVFIFARPVSGARMPLAARRLTLADLPVTLTLTDFDKMAGRSINDVESVIVGARLARSGQPIAAAGDLESAEQPIEVLHSATASGTGLSDDDLASLPVIKLHISQPH